MYHIPKTPRACTTNLRTPMHRNVVINEICHVKSLPPLPFSATRWQFHQHVYERLFRVNDKKLLKKTNFTMLFVQKLCWLCHSQVALGCAGCTGCHSQVAIRCAKKALKKLRIKMLMKLTPGGSMGPSYISQFLLGEKLQI